MGNLADYIEAYIKKLIESGSGNEVELQRRQLAERFECVPSQINYVLSTRFTVDRGYFIESRRGGGGYIRIIRIRLRPDDVLRQILEKSNGGLSDRQLADLLQRAVDSDIVSERVALVIRNGIEHELEDIPLSLRSILRGRFLRVILMVLLKRS